MNQPATVYPVDPEFAAKARITRDDYERLYAESVHEPEAFWGKVARAPGLVQARRRRSRTSATQLDDFHIRWYADGELNASVNCLDRHLDDARRQDRADLRTRRPEPAGRSTSPTATCTRASASSANALRNLGVRKGDRITIYLPMIPDAAVAMLACARIGAIHSVVFGGFAPNSIADRVADCASKLIITADEGLRGGKKVPLKANVDAALKHARHQHRRNRAGGAPHRRRGRHADAARPLVRRGGRRPAGRRARPSA